MKSDPTVIKAITAPSKPAAPSIVYQPIGKYLISWNAPASTGGVGLVLTQYKVQVRQSNGHF